MSKKNAKKTEDRGQKTAGTYKDEPTFREFVANSLVASGVAPGGERMIFEHGTAGNFRAKALLETSHKKLHDKKLRDRKRRSLRVGVDKAVEEINRINFYTLMVVSDVYATLENPCKASFVKWELSNATLHAAMRNFARGFSVDLK